MAKRAMQKRWKGSGHNTTFKITTDAPYYDTIQNETYVLTPEPLPNVLLDFWHCNATGSYSSFTQLSPNTPFVELLSQLNITDYDMGVTDLHTDETTFLRGMWPTDENGVTEVKTIFPGFYVERAIHIHVQVHTNWGVRGNGLIISSNTVSTGQLYFDEALEQKIHELGTTVGRVQGQGTTTGRSIKGREREPIRFGSPLYSIFPVVDFENTPIHLDPKVLNYHENPINPASYACLVALTAMITRIRAHESAFVDADPDAYVQAVLGLLPELVIDNTNLMSLETLVWLTLYIGPLGQPQLAGMILAMAIRILYNIGGNKHKQTYESPEQNRRNQHVRALFWLCYAIDKEMAFRECKTPLINDADCDLDIPPTYVSTSSDSSFFPKPLSSQELLFPSDIRLALIKSKIHRLLYSDQGVAQSEARRIQYIRELDQELSDFKSNFPVNCQPEGVLNRTVPDFLLHDLSLRGVNIHLEYYHCLAKIHGIIDPQSAVLTNIEVLAYLTANPPRRPPNPPPNSRHWVPSPDLRDHNTVVKEIHNYATRLSPHIYKYPKYTHQTPEQLLALAQSQSQSDAPTLPPIQSNAPTPMDVALRDLITQLQPYGLTKGEVLTIVNLGVGVDVSAPE
ncbi:hypothetical protein BBP40_008658, partial [Aspergillus hancockii]